MSWQAVARKDFRDALRSRWLWALTVLFVLVFAVPPVLLYQFGAGNTQQQLSNLTSDNYLYMMKQGIAFFVPLISIVVAYAAITRERESGTLKLLLSLPHSRDDVVFGKVLGRSGVVGVSVVAGGVAAAAALVVAGLQIKIVNYLLFVLLTLLLGLVFVGLSVGISAAASTSRRAMVGSVGLFFFFLVLWKSFAEQVANLIGKYAGVSSGGEIRTLLFIRLLNPLAAYKTMLDTVVIQSQFEARLELFNPLVQGTVARELGQPIPIYYSDAFVIAYMLFWLFVPIAVGYLVFSDADL